MQDCNQYVCSFLIRWIYQLYEVLNHSCVLTLSKRKPEPRADPHSESCFKNSLQVQQKSNYEVLEQTCLSIKLFYSFFPVFSPFLHWLIQCFTAVLLLHLFSSEIWRTGEDPDTLLLVLKVSLLVWRLTLCLGVIHVSSRVVGSSILTVVCSVRVGAFVSTLVLFDNFPPLTLMWGPLLGPRQGVSVILWQGCDFNFSAIFWNVIDASKGKT